MGTTKPFDPWSDLEWWEHLEAQQIVQRNPDGMTLEQVGEVLGITRERVRQIEAAALEKLNTGNGLAEAVTIDGITLAMMTCERCHGVFPRRGRAKMCIVCAPLPEGRGEVSRVIPIPKAVTTPTSTPEPLDVEGRVVSTESLLEVVAHDSHPAPANFPVFQFLITVGD